jgi:glyoxylase-like metal-dependent hydrolase (beta-lactamase superfamily II)
VNLKTLRREDMKIHPRVTQIISWFGEIKIALYLIRGQRNAIIDTGISQSPENDIAPALQDMGLSLADIALILNTHGHFDHTGGNAAVKSASNAQVLIHAGDIMLLENHEGWFAQHVEPLVEAMMGKEHIEEERALFLEMAGPDVPVDRQLKDNDIIELGDEVYLRVIHLPGHTSGSVVFYWEKEGMLFTGDSLQGMGEGDGWPPIMEDLAAYEVSLERLQRLPIEIILHAHGYRGLTSPSSTMRRGEEVRQYLRDCQEVAKRIGEVVRDIAPHASGRPFTEVYDQIVGRLPREMGFKPASQMLPRFLNTTTIFSYLNQVNR